MKTCEEYVLSRLVELEKLVKAKDEEIAQLKRESKTNDDAIDNVTDQIDRIMGFVSKHFFIRDAGEGEADGNRYRIVYVSDNEYVETIIWCGYDKSEYKEFLKLFDPKPYNEKKEDAE